MPLKGIAKKKSVNGPNGQEPRTTLASTVEAVIGAVRMHSKKIFRVVQITTRLSTQKMTSPNSVSVSGLGYFAF